MPVEATEPAEAEQLRFGQHAERVEHRVEAGDVVTLRREVDIAIRIVDAQLDRVQLFQVQPDDQIHRAEAGAEVTRTRALHGVERVEAAHIGEQMSAREPVRHLRTDAIEFDLRNELDHDDTCKASAAFCSTRGSVAWPDFTNSSARCQSSG
jgi:hypothetical protein